jgi:hypothetical protein
MRILALLFGIAWLTACEQAALPRVAAALEPELTPGDVTVLAAAVRSMVQNPRYGFSPSVPMTIVADRTLRICDDALDPECIPRHALGVLTAQTGRPAVYWRNQRSFRIRGTLGSEVTMQPAEFVFARLNAVRFQRANIWMFGTMTVLLTAPAYPSPDVAVVYVSAWNSNAIWTELKRAGSVWHFHRALGVWVY